MPKTILIAAVDPNITYLLQRYAEASGFRPVRAVEGNEMVQLAHRLHPDLIILEIELPETSTREAMQQLKDDPATQDIPVVVYSCYDEVPSSAADGAASYLQKSVMYSDFLAALEQAGVHAE
jgi:two-component system, cell cycle response regulator DivK